MYFGCSGLIIGIALGLAIGFSIKKKEKVVRFMRAVQCLNYFGIEVWFEVLQHNGVKNMCF